MIKQNEILNLLNSASIDEILAYSSEDLKNTFGEIIAIQKGYNQNNPHHCYTLLDHTLKTVESIRNMQINKEDKNLLLISALYHDVGKPYVKIDKGNRYVFYGHAKKSKELAYPLLTELGFNENEIKRILFFIENHDTFINFKLSSEYHNKYSTVISKKSVDKAVKKLMHNNDADINDIMLLIKLSKADVLAQSDIVELNNTVIDTKERKVERINKIEEILKNCHSE